MLLGWQDVVEGMFEVQARTATPLVLFNLVDELTYRAQSNLGPQAFRQLKKGMIVIGRLVPIRRGVDGFRQSCPPIPPRPAAQMLVARRPAGAAAILKRPSAIPPSWLRPGTCLPSSTQAFVDLFGADLIVVPGTEVPGKVEEFQRHLGPPGLAPMPSLPSLASLDFPDDLLDADSVAIHFVHGRGNELLSRLPPSRGTVRQPAP